MQDFVNNNAEARITLHVVSDFRQRDWALPDAEHLHQMLQTMAKNSRDFKVRLIDVAYPLWAKGQATVRSQDNVGILDLRAGTKVVGKAMPVNFTATISNFSGREAEMQMIIYDDATGREMLEVDLNPPMPLKISPATTATVTFELRFNPTIKPSEPYFAQISARLKSTTLGELENDGLSADNVRFAAVEVRDKVPILVVDGEAARSRDKGDSFFLKTAIESVPGASYDLVWGDELGGGVAAKALERADLARYPSIFMMNVRELTPKQLANLEAYVRDGGGVCFFMGPQVSGKYYTQNLYKEGTGLFPVPLRETFFPPPSDEPRIAEYTGFPQVLLREEQFGDFDRFPIFRGRLQQRFQTAQCAQGFADPPLFPGAARPVESRTGPGFRTGDVAERSAAINNYQGVVIDLSSRSHGQGGSNPTSTSSIAKDSNGIAARSRRWSLRARISWPIIWPRRSMRFSPTKATRKVPRTTRTCSNSGRAAIRRVGSLRERIRASCAIRFATAIPSSSRGNSARAKS